MQIRDIDWIETSGELGALLLESKLIKERMPSMNIKLRRSKDLCAWKVQANEEGVLVPTLVNHRDLLPGLQDDLFGLFYSKREANTYLKAIAKKHRLCEALLGLEKRSALGAAVFWLLLIGLAWTVVPLAGALLGAGLSVPEVFGATALGVWTRQIAGLVAAGMPLERALSALTEEADNERVRNLVATLRSEVNGGSPFARALSQHPREFSPIYTGVIAAGEQSGQLGTVLESLADDLETREALKNKLIGASLYPAIVTVVAIVIVVFLVSYVVPQVAGVFAGSKRALPFLTVVMLGLSDFVRSYGWLMLGMLVAGVGGVVFARRNEAIRLRIFERMIALSGGTQPRGGELAALSERLRGGGRATLGGAIVEVVRGTWTVRPEGPRR